MNYESKQSWMRKLIITTPFVLLFIVFCGLKNSMITDTSNNIMQVLDSLKGKSDIDLINTIHTLNKEGKFKSNLTLCLVLNKDSMKLNAEFPRYSVHKFTENNYYVSTGNGSEDYQKFTPVNYMVLRVIIERKKKGALSNWMLNDKLWKASKKIKAVYELYHLTLENNRLIKIEKDKKNIVLLITDRYNERY